jgi:hypothetical protein
MSDILTVNHVRILGGLLSTKSDDELKIMHRKLHRHVRRHATRIQPGDLDQVRRIASDAFPEAPMHDMTYSKILGGKSPNIFTSYIMPILLLFALAFLIAGANKLHTNRLHSIRHKNAMAIEAAEGEVKSAEAARDQALFSTYGLTNAFTQLGLDRSGDLSKFLDGLEPLAMLLLGKPRAKFPNFDDCSRLLISRIALPVLAKALRLKNLIAGQADEELRYIHVSLLDLEYKLYVLCGVKNINIPPKDDMSEAENIEYIHTIDEISQLTAQINTDWVKILNRVAAIKLSYAENDPEATKQLMTDMAKYSNFRLELMNYVDRNISTIDKNCVDDKGGNPDSCKAILSMMESLRDSIRAASLRAANPRYIEHMLILIGTSRYWARMTSRRPVLDES